MDFSRLKILVVDDNQRYFAMVLLDILKSIGFIKEKMILALNGEWAIIELNKNDDLPDIILSDYRMPGMKGLDFLKKIKSSDKTRNIPFILMSSLQIDDGMTDLNQKCEELGGDGFVLKGNMEWELEGLIEEIFERRGA